MTNNLSLAQLIIEAGYIDVDRDAVLDDRHHTGLMLPTSGLSYDMLVALNKLTNVVHAECVQCHRHTVWECECVVIGDDPFDPRDYA